MFHSCQCHGYSGHRLAASGQLKTVKDQVKLLYTYKNPKVDNECIYSHIVTAVATTIR